MAFMLRIIVVFLPGTLLKSDKIAIARLLWWGRGSSGGWQVQGTPTSSVGDSEVLPYPAAK